MPALTQERNRAFSLEKPGFETWFSTSRTAFPTPTFMKTHQAPHTMESLTAKALSVGED